MKNCLVLFLISCTTLLSGQNIFESCKTGQPLIDAIQASYTPTLTLGYGPARDTLYSKIDNKGLELSGIYTDFTITLEPGVDPSISAFQNENGLNAEHVYPQSKGARDEPGRSDMHHLFPSKVSVNSARGSCIFGDIEDTDTEFWFILGDQLTQIPSTNIDGYSEKDEESCVFEPRESVKGDIARAVFYFYTIYQQKVEQEDANFFPRQKETLLKWHRADPISEKELRRNDLIAFYQGNLNPFIVDTTLVERAFFKEDAVYEPGDANCFIIVSNNEVPQKKWVQISTTLSNYQIEIKSTKRENHLVLANINGQIIKKEDFSFNTQLNITNVEAGYYFLLIQSEGKRQVFKVAIFH